MEGKALDTKSSHNSKAQLSEKYSPNENVQNVYSTSEGLDGVVAFTVIG